MGVLTNVPSVQVRLPPLVYRGVCAMRRFGRAMLRPLFDQTAKRNGIMGIELDEALKRWVRVLEAGLAESRVRKQPRDTAIDLLCTRISSTPWGGCLSGQPLPMDAHGSTATYSGAFRQSQRSTNYGPRIVLNLPWHVHVRKRALGSPCGYSFGQQWIRGASL